MNGSERMIEELRALVAEQAARLEEQAARIAELELALAQAKKDSSTSSKPPSSDLVQPRPKNKKPGRRQKPRRGAQRGHEQHLRQPLPPDRVDEIVEYGIDDNEVKRLGLRPTGDFETIQHIELPKMPVQVTEYWLTVYQDVEGRPQSPLAESSSATFSPSSTIRSQLSSKTNVRPRC